MTAEAFAPAKINLALHVTGRRPDGLHLLDSVVVFADAGDWLRLSPAPRLSLAVTGPRAAGLPAGEDNLVLRAARSVGGPPVAITLEKHLPAAAGLGGGSSDAAATLRGLAALGRAALPGVEALTALGADLPVCLAARPARMRGIGEVLDPLPPLPDCHLVLVNPGATLPTGAVFAGLGDHDNAPMPADLPGWADAAGLAGWLAAQRNDLEAPAMALAPGLHAALQALRGTGGCLLARMSGSGATCFGLYGEAEAAGLAADELAKRHPGWWVVAAKLLKGAPEVRIS